MIDIDWMNIVLTIGCLFIDQQSHRFSHRPIAVLFNSVTYLFIRHRFRFVGLFANSSMQFFFTQSP